MQTNLFPEEKKSTPVVEDKNSRAAALAKIKAFLDVDNVDAQFDNRSGNYYSKEKFIVSWWGTWNGMDAEFSINKSDSFYAAYSGYKATYSTQGLFHEKQLGGYDSIERALIVVGLKLCPKKEKKTFWNKYAEKFNAKLEIERKNLK